MGEIEISQAGPLVQILDIRPKGVEQYYDQAAGYRMQIKPWTNIN